MSLDSLSPDARTATERLLLAMGDDEFAAGQRLTAWVAVGPTMEEDNVLSSIAQDELGHARLWYELIAEQYPDYDLDDLAFKRPAGERRNSRLVEQEHTDFADTIAINYLYDEAEVRLLEALEAGDVDVLRERASQALAEEPFHREHADRWLDRLVATEAGQRRVARALEDGLERAADLFAFDEATVETLESAGVLGSPVADLQGDWLATVRARLSELPVSLEERVLEAPAEPPAMNGRAGDHATDLEAMIDEMHGDVVGPHPVNRPFVTNP